MITYKIPQWGIGWPDNTFNSNDINITYSYDIDIGDKVFSSKAVYHVAIVDKETDEIVLDFTVVADSEEKAKMKGVIVAGIDDVDKVSIIASYLGAVL